MAKIAIPVFDSLIANYVVALRFFGADTEVIKSAEIDINEYDGLLLPGGVDVDPTRYGQVNTDSLGVDRQLDELQMQVLDMFVKAGKPVLGVCRGMQVIDVYFGGALNQDIETRQLHYGERLVSSHNEDCKVIDRVHGSRIAPNSWLYQLYGGSASINSFHHQAVQTLGKGLKTVQCSPLGIVEGIAHESLPIYGVQWHPERCGLENLRNDTVDGSLVYRFFMEQCKKAAFLQQDKPAV